MDGVWAANTDWSTFSLVPDSHERLSTEWFERSDRAAIENTNLSTAESIDYEKLRARMLDGGQWAEKMLVRAVRIGKVPLEKKITFKSKQEALDKKLRELLDAKLAELKAKGAPPPTDPPK